MPPSLPALTTHFATLAPHYDVLLCDVWGVVHNGVAATVESCAALVRFRGHGGTVVLITNAPRPGDFVQTFIDNLKVPRDSYDAIVSSGDVTRALVAERRRVGPPAPAHLLGMDAGRPEQAVEVEGDGGLEIGA